MLNSISGKTAVVRFFCLKLTPSMLSNSSHCSSNHLERDLTHIQYIQHPTSLSGKQLSHPDLTSSHSTLHHSGNYDQRLDVSVFIMQDCDTIVEFTYSVQTEITNTSEVPAAVRCSEVFLVLSLHNYNHILMICFLLFWSHWNVSSQPLHSVSISLKDQFYWMFSNTVVAAQHFSLNLLWITMKVFLHWL